MPHHEATCCPRCHASFECKAGNISECHCSGFTFTEEEREYMAQQYAGCLCRKCLQEIKHEMRLRSFNRKVNQLIAPITKR